MTRIRFLQVTLFRRQALAWLVHWVAGVFRAMCLLPPLFFVGIWIIAYVETQSFWWATVSMAGGGLLLMLLGYAGWRQWRKKRRKAKSS